MTYSIDLPDRGAFMTGAPSSLGAEFARSHANNRILISADDGFGV